MCDRKFFYGILLWMIWAVIRKKLKKSIDASRASCYTIKVVTAKLR